MSCSEDAKFPLLRLTGRGTRQFLHGQTSAAIEQAPEQSLIHTCWLRATGRVRALLEVRLDGEGADVLVLCGDADAVLEGFDRSDLSGGPRESQRCRTPTTRAAPTSRTRAVAMAGRRGVARQPPSARPLGCIACRRSRAIGAMAHQPWTAPEQPGTEYRRNRSSGVGALPIGSVWRKAAIWARRPWPSSSPAMG